MIHDRLLERLVKIKQTQSISKAADEMHISRSALVQQVKQAEEEIGFTIFDRYSYGTVATIAGDKFLEEMQKLMRRYDSIISDCCEINKKGTEEIVIGSLPNLKSVFLQQECMRFSSMHPNVIFKFKDYPMDEYLRKFHRNELDICAEYMMDYFIEDSEITFKKMRETRYVCGFANGHKLYGKESIRFSDLRGEKLIMYNKGISRTADRLRLYIRREEPDIELIGIDEYDSNLYTRCVIENAVLMMFADYESCFNQFSYSTLDANINIELGVGYHRECRPIVREFVEQFA